MNLTLSEQLGGVPTEHDLFIRNVMLGSLLGFVAFGVIFVCCFIRFENWFCGNRSPTESTTSISYIDLRPPNYEEAIAQGAAPSPKPRRRLSRQGLDNDSSDNANNGERGNTNAPINEESTEYSNTANSNGNENSDTGLGNDSPVTLSFIEGNVVRFTPRRASLPIIEESTVYSNTLYSKDNKNRDTCLERDSAVSLSLREGNVSTRIKKSNAADDSGIKSDGDSIVDEFDDVSSKYDTASCSSVGGGSSMAPSPSIDMTDYKKAL